MPWYFWVALALLAFILVGVLVIAWAVGVDLAKYVDEDTDDGLP